MHYILCIPYVHTVCIGVHDMVYSTWHCILCIGAIACATRYALFLSFVLLQISGLLVLMIPLLLVFPLCTPLYY